MINIELKGNRKPSKAYIMRTIGVCIESGHKDIELTWGENWLELVKGGNKWHGCGWIKEIGGDDIAHELNTMEMELNAI